MLLRAPLKRRHIAPSELVVVEILLRECLHDHLVVLFLEVDALLILVDDVLDFFDLLLDEPGHLLLQLFPHFVAEGLVRGLPGILVGPYFLFLTLAHQFCSLSMSEYITLVSGHRLLVLKQQLILKLHQRQLLLKILYLFFVLFFRLG